jgi:(p)ppGpp synthase/HD superfamily hydrolase
MNEQEQLSHAIHIASTAHLNQYDKGGKPYILHPIHLMTQLLFDVQLATIAVLHDVVEDSDITIEKLSGIGFSKRVINALELLTHKKEVPYEQYIEKICTNYDAVRVKRKDLEHNSDITRLVGIKERDIRRIEKYHRAFIRLSEAKEQFLNA